MGLIDSGSAWFARSYMVYSHSSGEKAGETFLNRVSGKIGISW